MGFYRRSSTDGAAAIWDEILNTNTDLFIMYGKS